MKLYSSTLLLLAVTSTLASSTFHPTHISRSIELGGALTRSTTVYTLQHNPAAATAGAHQQFLLSVPSGAFKAGDEAAAAAGFVEAHVGKQGSRKLVQLEQVEGKINSYRLNLPTPSTSDPTILTVLSVTSHVTHPKPASLPQTAEAVLMLWESDLLESLGLSEEARSQVQEVKIKVKAPSPRIGEIKAPTGFELSYTKGGATATFTSRAPLAEFPAGPQIATLHYAQPEAITSIRNLDRLVEVSHWGANLAVQDNIDLYNGGPTLQGHFSRLHHQRATMQRRITALSITSLSFALPPNVHSPYYYDIVGNVSTSRFRPSSPAPAAGASAKLPSQRKGAPFSLLEIVPRYPLMGGWNYTFTVGYDAPLADYHKARPGKSGEYVLQVPFLTPVKDVAVDQVRVEIRLPEGASNIAVHVPFPVDSLVPANGEVAPLTRTYLDSTGRPTIVLTKAGCTDKHGDVIMITYHLSPLRDLLQKPLAIAAVLGLVFGAIIFAKQLDWAIPGAVVVVEGGKGKGKVE